MKGKSAHQRACTAIVTALLIFTQTSLVCQVADPLAFPKDKFTVETRTVNTPAGAVEVSYRAYMHIPYVSKPVDAAYQSLNVFVPVTVGGKNVDASGAPILLVIGVGGYMSVKNAGTTSVPAAGGQGPGGARGGPGNKLSNRDLALAAGYVVVVPGCRGRDNVAPDGTYYGKAPAAIVDLKAAVRYVRQNRGVLPGNTDWIFSTGVSAGGALSALLGSSGNSPMYEPWLKEIGAADEADNIFGSACFCPITDLEHADGAYEWMYGKTPGRSGLADQELSARLRSDYAVYQESLKLEGRDGFGRITAENFDRYLLRYYLVPSAEKYLRALPDEKRSQYLASNPWIKYSEGKASFSFPDYVSHVGRMKGLPAFDDFDMKQPEPVLFGNSKTNARHFTDFSLRHSSGNMNAVVDPEVRNLVNLMNAMYFIGSGTEGCAGHWWLRQGSSDNHTSQTVMANLAVSLENRGRNVNASLYWDAGHGADEDPEEFISWIGKVTGKN